MCNYFLLMYLCIHRSFSKHLLIPFTLYQVSIHMVGIQDKKAVYLPFLISSLSSGV